MNNYPNLDVVIEFCLGYCGDCDSGSYAVNSSKFSRSVIERNRKRVQKIGGIINGR